ncbi:RNA polymerase sigma-70 factor [Niabella aquatica]
MSQGDEKAFACIVQHYHALVYHFISKHTSRKDWVSEIANDVFMQLWQKRETACSIQDLNRYLFVLCKHQAINVMKRELRETARNREWSLLHKDAMQGLEDEHSAQLQLVEAAISQLSDRQRQIWIMSRYKKLTYEQIAAAMNIGRETVKSHLQSANRVIKFYVLQHADILLYACFFIHQLV